MEQPGVPYLPSETLETSYFALLVPSFVLVCLGFFGFLAFLSIR